MTYTHGRLQIASLSIPPKRQLIWFGTPQKLQKLDLFLLAENFPQFIFSTGVSDLVVTLHSSLTFSEHITCTAYMLLLLSTPAYQGNAQICVLIHLDINSPCICLL